MARAKRVPYLQSKTITNNYYYHTLLQYIKTTSLFLTSSFNRFPCDPSKSLVTHLYATGPLTMKEEGGTRPAHMPATNDTTIVEYYDTILHYYWSTLPQEQWCWWCHSSGVEQSRAERWGRAERPSAISVFVHCNDDWGLLL